MLRFLTLRIGSRVSLHELGQTIGANAQTAQRYSGLLEKTVALFRLGACSRNLRNEIKKRHKICFHDNGMRNAVIATFASLAMRTDAGALWENYLASERMKANHYRGHWCNCYFWRPTARQEIDYLEEAEGTLSSWEFKWGRAKSAGAPRQSLCAA